MRSSYKVNVSAINKSKRTLRQVNRNNSTMKLYFVFYAVTLFFRYFGIY